MIFEDYRVKYLAYEITRRFPSGSSERFNRTLADAQVDLNPHQVEAALFAFKSPLSKGVLLADEVGLGKTIEAGILLSQLWAERKRKLIIVCPANLRKQWSLELKEKFYLESIILESKSFKEYIKEGNSNPFNQSKIVICSFQFARSKADILQLINWDLAVIDEAHRLRNVYKPGNKIGNAIKNGLHHSRKVLLTATPLQNSLLELYGLVSIIDEYTFGDVKSFRSQFLRVIEGDNYEDLKDRLKPVCIRNLRRQVQEYIKYTNRIPLTIKFEPTADEQKLYEEVSNYLQKEFLFALPKSQRHLMTLILRKLLASSSYAIAGTLNILINRLKKLLKEQEEIIITDDLSKEYELFDENKEEWEEESDSNDVEEKEVIDTEKLKEEIKEIEEYRDLAESIKHNAKGEKLITALNEGFKKISKMANQKAIIFTESTRTQNYLFRLLSEKYDNEVVLFNGSNNDELSNKIYNKWISDNTGTDRISGSPTADKRAALIDYFRNEATIMIATEAAAEGVNLQFCSLVINYDLPWNPQRIEQRIGRCHRYGQKFDVVVVNFLNIKNAADVRVFQLLDEKFKLFKGVFGASDEVLGSIETGIDFEKRIAEIYQKCRTEEDITSEFDLLQKELDEQINKKIISTREKLLSNFDDEVVEKLKIRLTESREYINKFERWLWQITKHALVDSASFNETDFTFKLLKQPFEGSYFPTESFKLGKPSTEAHVYRIGHPLAQNILESIKQKELPTAKIVFNLSGYTGNISILNELKGKTGWLSVTLITNESFETSEHILCYGLTDENIHLSDEQVKRILNLPVTNFMTEDFKYKLRQKEETEKLIIEKLSVKIAKENSNYLNLETKKLNKWAEDRVNAAEAAIKETKDKIRELNRVSIKTENPTEQLKIQEKLQELSRLKKKQRQEIFNAEDEINEARDRMIEEIQKRLQQKMEKKHIFTIQWELI